MPIDLLIEPERRLVTIRMHGVISEDAFEDYRRRLAAAPDFKPEFEHLIEITEDARPGFGTATVQRISDSDPFSSESRRAFVVASDLAYGMVRMWMGYTQVAPDKVGLFRTIDEALAWLGKQP